MKIIVTSSYGRLIPLLAAAITSSHGLIHAAPTVVDSFLTGGSDYNTSLPLFGQGPAATGFTGNWIDAYFGAESPNVIAGGLSYSDGTNNVISAGGAVEYPLGGSGRVGRLLSAPFTNATSGTVYFSVMIQPDTTGTGYRGVEMHGGSLGDGDRRLQIVTGENGNSNFSVRLFNNNDFGFLGDLGAADTNVNFFVGKFTFSTDNDSDSLQLWRNPGNLTSEILSGTANFTKAGFNLQIDRVALARFNGADGFKGDEIRFGNTWSDVTTVAADTDADGLPDDYEQIIIDADAFDAVTDLTHVAGPNNAPTTTDFDNDGSSDAAERVNGTNPIDNDSDNDGLQDGVESNSGTYLSLSDTGTNPLNPDTDNDGLKDGVENNSGAFLSASQTGTNPHTTDYDGDGENDGTEVFHGTIPTQFSSSSAALGNPLIDGTLDTPLYGAPVAVQTIQTSFGDNTNEWNAAYGKVVNGKLYLNFTGNLEANFNKLSIFIDSKAGGSTTFTSSGNDGSSAMNTMKFDVGFRPDYHLIARRGFSQFDFDMAILGTSNFSTFGNVFGGSAAGRGITGTGSGNTQPIRMAYDGSNTAGIGGDPLGSAADQTAAAAVTTGLEICIDLADLGNPAGPITVMLLQSSNDHTFLSNQTLGGLPDDTGSLGNPTLVDFSLFAGPQFFFVGGTGGYADWAIVNADHGALNDDFDADGVRNGIEYFFGETGSSFTANPGPVGGIVKWPDANAAGVDFRIWKSETLAQGSWVNVTGAADLSESGFIKYTLPTTTPKLFVRFEVFEP